MDLVVDILSELDGIAINNLSEMRFNSGVFDLVFPEENIYDVVPGPTKSVTDGFWVMLKPLQRGKQVVRFSGGALIPERPAEKIANRYLDYNNHLFPAFQMDRGTKNVMPVMK